VALDIVLDLANQSLTGIAEDAQMLRQPDHKVTTWALRQLFRPLHKGRLCLPIAATIEKRKQQSSDQDLDDVSAKGSERSGEQTRRQGDKETRSGRVLCLLVSFSPCLGVWVQ